MAKVPVISCWEGTQLLNMHSHSRSTDHLHRRTLKFIFGGGLNHEIQSEFQWCEKGKNLNKPIELTIWFNPLIGGVEHNILLINHAQNSHQVNPCSWYIPISHRRICKITSAYIAANPATSNLPLLFSSSKPSSTSSILISITHLETCQISHCPSWQCHVLGYCQMTSSSSCHVTLFLQWRH